MKFVWYGFLASRNSSAFESGEIKDGANRLAETDP